MGGNKKGGKGAEPERRIDPTDGKAYTRTEFEKCYGGTSEWETAKKVGGNRSQPPPEPKARIAPEIRRDPADGRVYTKQDFIDQYGGVKEWNAAEKVSEDRAPERRIDPADNKFYTKDDFVDQYGGTKEWDAAAKTSTKKTAPPPQQQQQQQQRSPPASRKGGGKGDSKGSKNQKGGGGPLPSDVEISDICHTRHNLRKSRKYKEADELKAKLQRWGIRLDEDQQMWYGPQGRSGGYTPAPETRQRVSDIKMPPDEEITDLCRQRAAFRKSKKFKEADEVKRKILSFGITLNDDNQEWHGPSGKSGSWADTHASAAASSEEMKSCFQKPDNTTELETFLTGSTEGINTATKITILLALPMEIFWGLFVHSQPARNWASETAISLLKGSTSDQDTGSKLVARFALFKEDSAHRRMFNCRDYAQLFCSNGQIFSVINLGVMASAATKIPLLKESICAVLFACHSFYTTPKKMGVFDTFLKTVDGECSDVIDSCITPGKNAWPSVAKTVKRISFLLAETLWPLIRVAPFLVRTLTPISNWVKLFAQMYEVPVMCLIDKTNGHAGHDIATALVDIMRLVLMFFPFDRVEGGRLDNDFGFQSTKIEQAILQSMKKFALVTPIRIEYLPHDFESLIRQTFGNDGTQSFLLSELLCQLHSYTDEVAGKASFGKGKKMPTGVEHGSFLVDLLVIFKMKTGLLRDLVNQNKMTESDFDTVNTITEGLLASGGRSPGVSPSVTPRGERVEIHPEAETLISIAGTDVVKNTLHASKILSYFDGNMEKAVSAIFDANLPPHLLTPDPEPQPRSSTTPPTSPSKHPLHRHVPVRQPVTASTNPERFLNIQKLIAQQKVKTEDDGFDEILRSRILESQKSYEYCDEADDACDYMPGGALEEEKKRRAMQSHSYERVVKLEDGADDDIIERQDTVDCPSDEEWGGYGESDDDEEEEKDDDSNNQKGGKSGGRKGGKGGKGGFPRTISGEATGEKIGKSSRRRATDEDKKRRTHLDKNKARYVLPNV
eukprot:TRINITY_DN1432_c0_g1_i3.p1 TRINITY_DN1432_c0_g1~~TRINITY_DN1432_c0_g1_i3.p1  ORF type:complete len:1011 (+),score=223.24 TRINITY_DN1432_c0_g1_i3:40-3072(+)